MSPEVQALLQSGVQRTDAALERLLPGPETPPHSIHRAMRHSTFAGGKRLRPILAMEAARAVSNTPQLPLGADDLGAAIEMVHTYSLIHDDLPALDNDDLRRGQPTCHVVFGEATAILAGDALQTLAFQTLAQLPTPPATAVAILREVSLAIGTGLGAASDVATPPATLEVPESAAPGGLPPGMIGGQVVDLESEGATPTADLVEQIHRAKTGALITVSVVAGGLLGLGTRTDLAPHEHTDLLARLRTFGQNAGLAFQIVDDILDMTEDSAQLGKTAGKDTASTKATWPAVFGIEHSQQDARQFIEEAFAALAPLGEAAAPLKTIAQYLVDRRS